jgi:hypothetical protein
MGLHLRPLPIRQNQTIHIKLLAELESCISRFGNHDSQQTLGSGLNLGPPDDDSREGHGCGEIPGEFVVSCGDAPPILEMSKGPLDQVP